jgi:hypothetical protein
MHGTVLVKIYRWLKMKGIHEKIQCLIFVSVNLQMAIVLISFLIACTGLLSGILKHYRSNGHGIFGLLFLALAALNGFNLYPIVSFDVDDQYISSTP